MSETFITTVEELLALPESSAVCARKGDVRVKTYMPDEWDLVMSSEEVLKEGNGRVALIKGEERDITDEEELVSLPQGSVVRTGKLDVRVKTHSGDEWDFVMGSSEILQEGKGKVTFVG